MVKLSRTFNNSKATGPDFKWLDHFKSEPDKVWYLDVQFSHSHCTTYVLANIGTWYSKACYSDPHCSIQIGVLSYQEGLGKTEAQTKSMWAGTVACSVKLILRFSGLKLVWSVKVRVTLDRVKSGVKAMSTSIDWAGSTVKGSQFSTLKPWPSQGWPSISKPEM